MASFSSAVQALGVTRFRVILAVTLVATWWFASIIPHYQPIIVQHFKSRLDDARQKIPILKVDWNTDPDEDPRLAYNQTKIALIIEPRPLPHLVSQIMHMIAVVPPDWRFLMIGSEHSVISVGRSTALQYQQLIGKLDLMVMPEPWRVDTKEHVFRMMTDARFYDEFLPGVEHIFKFESDSILCSNSPTSLNEWLHWDWAGAPRHADDKFAGNGGLSLRRVSVIKRVLSFQSRYNDTDPEDEWFGQRLATMPDVKVPHGNEQALTVEDTYFPNSMGFHVRDGGSQLADEVWKNYDQRMKILAYCPEVAIVMDMKLDRERCDGDDREGVVHGTPPEEQEEQRRKQKEEEANRQREEQEKMKKEAEEAKAKKGGQKRQAARRSMAVE